MTDKMFKFVIAALVAIMFSPLLLLVPGCFGGCGRGYSDGERVGTVVKLSNKGLMWKSWEGEMNLGGTVAGENGAIPSTWRFHLTDPTLAPKFDAAMTSGKRVKVRYVQWAFSPVTQDSDYDVTSITELP
jgi:hypothetical protein